MYASRFGKRKANRAKRPVKRVPRKRSGGRQAIVKIVKSVISRQAENKIWADYGVNQSIVTTNLAVPTFKNLLPILNQGATSSTRIGNEIRIKSGYIRGHVNLLPFQATTNNLPLPCYVKMWVCSNRTVNSQALSATNIASDFFDAGGTNTGFQANMLDIDFSPNKDVWVIHATKTVRLGVGYATGATVATSSYFDNSPMSLPFQFNFGKKLTGALKFNETTTSASNKNMFIIFQCVPATGQDGSTQVMAEFHYTTRVEYEDL